MKPNIPITDSRFEYVPSYQTDISKTFEKVKRELDYAQLDEQNYQNYDDEFVREYDAWNMGLEVYHE